MYDQILSFCDTNNYQLLTKKEDILTNQSVVEYVCPKHGIHKTKVTNILQGKLCYECSREGVGTRVWAHSLQERMNRYYHIALEKCKDLGYKLLSKENEIISYNTYVRYECPIHGEHTMKYGNLISGKHCPDCAHPKSQKIKDCNPMVKQYPKNKLTKEEVIHRVETCGGKVLNPEDYMNLRERNLDITCPRCGQVFTTSLALFTQHGGQLCNDCCGKQSVGELRIQKYLESHNISFIPEHCFIDCRDVKPLPFDFYLDSLNIAIEFDGSQHFCSGKKFFHKSYNFDTVKKHDDIKTNYCKENQIKLIRIPYWQIDKIDKILDKEINYSHEDIV